MKKIYKKPEISTLEYMDELMLTTNTKTNVNISGGDYDPITGPITEVGDGEEGEPSGAKGNDLWIEDDDE
jgi:hypothetical protein